MSNSVFTVNEPFKIFVGDNTVNKISMGFLDRGKATLREGTAISEIEYTGGDVTFPNYWEAWGRRVIGGKPNSDGTPIEVTNPKYTGEIEFLNANDNNGQVIYCRYVKGQLSLDYDYQTIRLGLVKKELDEQNLLLTLSRGEHKIDPNRDKAFALTLKIHPMNGDSKCKTGRYTNTLYKEVKVFETTQSSVKALDIDFEAKKTVKDSSSSFAKLKVLHAILSEDKEIKFDKSDESSLYDALMLFANESPEEVLRLVRKYKEQTSGVIEMAKSENAFDTATNGKLSVGSIKKTIILADIPKEHKGDNMIQYLFDNCLEPKAFEGINKLHELKNNNFK